jgi:hypothetical protein
MPPVEPNDEEKQEQLPEDGQTPFRPADPPRDDTQPPDATGQQAASTIDPTHPVTDTNVQPEETYDEGVSGAAEAAEPNAGNAVTDYTSPPSEDAPPSAEAENEDPNPEIENQAL